MARWRITWGIVTSDGTHLSVTGTGMTVDQESGAVSIYDGGTLVGFYWRPAAVEERKREEVA